MRALNRGAFARRERLTHRAVTSWRNVDATSKSSEPVQVLIGAMEGQRIDAETFLLYRAVSANDAIYRQGLILELEPLVSWLEERVLGQNELHRRSRVFLGDHDPGESPGVYRFRHRYADPFQDIENVLVLASLPAPRGAGYVYLLSTLLVLSATAALFGLYRFVSTEVAWAERRHSFVSAVSHELRTPLTAIRMHGEMLRDGTVLDEEKRQEYYDVITSESERLTRLVNNALQLSRYEREGREPEAAAVKPIVDRVVEALGPHARTEGFELRVAIEPDLPEAMFDRDGLQQVLINLVDNAVKYSGNGASSTEKKIVIRANALGKRVEIAVTDSGPGVAPAEQSRLFEPFYRAGRQDETPRGSGIGLTLVRRLVEEMGGTIRSENREDGSFTVRVTLPTST